MEKVKEIIGIQNPQWPFVFLKSLKVIQKDKRCIFGGKWKLSFALVSQPLDT